MSGERPRLAADRERVPDPGRVAPMLARAGELPSGDGQDGCWAFEVKWDGVRALACLEDRRLRLHSRNLRDITAHYPELGGLADALHAREALLDGEIVALDARGHPSFELLQRRMNLISESAVRRAARATPVTYMAFDLLRLDGRWLIRQPWTRRRAALEALALEGSHWRTPAARRGDGTAFRAATARQGLEGVVAKRVDSPYEPGRRSGAWIKVKHRRSVELCIGGWLPGAGRRARHIGALLVGQRAADGGLRYAGRVGTGFDASELDRLQALLAPLERASSPFTGSPAPPREARFADPALRCEVEFAEWTCQGVLRAPSYRGLRGTAAVSAIPQARARGLKLSNPEKVLYPAAGFTKGDVVDYYARIAPVLLAHLRDRPLTLKRCPDGVAEEHFFAKRAPAPRPDWVATAAVASARAGEIDYTLAQDAPTLVWLANLAALELHAALHRAGDPARPTLAVFDLDPGPGADVRHCARVALRLRALFERLALRSAVKTSGAKGLQVCVPLNTPVTYAQTKSFARALAGLLERDDPALVTSRMARKARANRVFVDWGQNDAHKTTIAVYSLRARERPWVSTPVSWEELEAALGADDPAALAFDAPTVLARVDALGDLFAEVLRATQDLPALG